MKKICLLCAFVAFLICLTGCSEIESQNTYHGDYTLCIGDSVNLELTAIPEGYGAEDYQWVVIEPALFEIDERGTGKALSGGQTRVRAELETKDMLYQEEYSIQVIYEREVFEFTQDSYEKTLDTAGLGVPAVVPDLITLVTDVPPKSFEDVKWASSAPDVADVIVYDGGEESAAISQKGVGTAVITATLGSYVAECTVTVTDCATHPDTVLFDLSTLADESLVLSGKTAFVNCDSIDCTVQPEDDAGGGGKYMVLVDYEYEYATGAQTSQDNGSSLPTGFSSETLSKGVGYTGLLPENMRAAAMDEVSYIIHVVNSEPIKSSTYSDGVQGYLRTVEIRLEDAVTGEIIEVLDSFTGSLDDSYYVDENAKEVYSATPAENTIIDGLYRILSDYWLEQYQSVAFYIDGQTIRYYGSGEIIIPEALGITKMSYNGVYSATEDVGIDRFVIPDGVELTYCPGWDMVSFVITPDSLAEEYCIDHNLKFEYAE